MTAYIATMYLLIAFMAMGSWGLYIMLVVLSNLRFINGQFLVLRIAVTAYGTVAYGLLAFASYNVSVSDGAGGELVKTYPSLAFFALAGSIATSLFLIDSIMKLFDEEAEGSDAGPGDI